MLDSVRYHFGARCIDTTLMTAAEVAGGIHSTSLRQVAFIELPSLAWFLTLSFGMAKRKENPDDYGKTLRIEVLAELGAERTLPLLLPWLLLW